MRLLWWIPITIVAIGVGAFLRGRARRRDDGVALTSEPVSSEWLAQARGRDEQGW